MTRPIMLIVVPVVYDGGDDGDGCGDRCWQPVQLGL